jgi:hypothetical protein
LHRSDEREFPALPPRCIATAMPVPEPDRSVADAINRVLEAEQSAAAAIAAAEAQAREIAESARESRRRILDRARRRVIQLHERAEVRQAERLARLDATAPDEVPAADGLRVIADQALAAVAARLTTDATP